MQVTFPFDVPVSTTNYGLTFRDSKRQPYHRWYPYVEGFSAPYVQKLLTSFGTISRVLDPFGGAGTTQVEASILGLCCFYSELNPFMRFVADTKVNASIWAREHLPEATSTIREFDKLLSDRTFATRAKKVSLLGYNNAFEERDYFEEQHVRELLAARDAAVELAGNRSYLKDLLLLAVSANTVRSSNMTRRADLRRRRPDEYKERIVDVPGFVREKLSEMLDDLRSESGPTVPSQYACENAKEVGSNVENIDIALTSPPYLNGTNYCRNTKLEQWLLGFLHNEAGLRDFREKAIAAGINNVNSKRQVLNRFDFVEEVARKVEARGGDKRIPALIRNYFSDMFDVLKSVLTALKPGARFILDIGDSKFYGVHVPTDLFLARVAEQAGFELESTRSLAKRYSYDRSLLQQIELTLRKPLPIIRRNTNGKPKLLQSVRSFGSDLHSRMNEFERSLPYKDEPYSSRRWGHELHSLCSYQGKMKPAVAHWLITLFTKEGLSVLDPLGGVGTIPFEACLQGRVGISNDLSPLAYAVATPKVDPPEPTSIHEALDRFERVIRKARLTKHDYDSAKFGLNGTVAEFYHPDTLDEVLKARKYFLGIAQPSNADLLIKASLLHVLHGNRPYALSRTSHPITPFHPTGEAVYKSVLEHVKKRINQISKTELPLSYVRGRSFRGNFRLLRDKIDPVDAIITSPPFWGMRFDRPNWLRMWFCGWNADDFHQTSREFLERQQTRSLDVYAEFFEFCRAVLRDSGIMVLHLGGSDEHEMVPKLTSLAESHFKLIGTISEDSTEHEHHGIKDKGLTTTHNFIFLRP